VILIGRARGLGQPSMDFYELRSCARTHAHPEARTMFGCLTSTATSSSGHMARSFGRRSTPSDRPSGEVLHGYSLLKATFPNSRPGNGRLAWRSLFVSMKEG
jgi:hypothetical protein